MEEHHLQVSKTARYYTLGYLTDKVDNIWFVCHGYGQLANYFIRNFEAINDGKTYVVAPEGLSRFYLNGFTGRIGAAWMTKEDRLNEIADYVHYLDMLYGHIVKDKLKNKKTKVTVLGFSQGTTTACRWIGNGRVQPDNLVLWAGVFPPDLSLNVTDKLFKAIPNIALVYGSQDAFVQETNIDQQKALFGQAGLSFEVISFPGKHEIDSNTLKELAEKFKH